MELDVIRAHCGGKNVIIDILDVGVTHMDSSVCYLPRDESGKLKSKKEDNNSIEILSQNEKISLNFNEDIDLASQKIRISQKIDNLNKQINSLVFAIS